MELLFERVLSLSKDESRSTLLWFSIPFSLERVVLRKKHLGLTIQQSNQKYATIDNTIAQIIMVQ
ncbi:hypothetical protein AMJ87_04090 [candidate division WOR_3 bacterium SM23_60]|uniref:Uncharacterized protein n=1 Tax=candidate division WOR_3 bacterium SM23_60 TaxID=1703780 RepID=A0A0S8GJ75_UNCW3|nr:MAG: hypothetical protein AMJ87_04090 [candidate division WOR_3 bacterium SM23_60]